VLTLSILALVVSTGALALGVHSTRVANGATGRARQQELRDQLQIVVARLPEEFLAVAVKVGIANDAGGVPASFNGLRERLDGIAQRLASIFHLGGRSECVCAGLRLRDGGRVWA